MTITMERLDLDEFVTEIQSGIKVGDLVITNQGKDTYLWQGPSDTPGTSTFSFALGRGETSKIWTSISNIAPSGTPLADPKDDRVDVVKGQKPGPWLPGDWCLRLRISGGLTIEGWFKTKTDALERARYVLAVHDFHTSAAAAVKPQAAIAEPAAPVSLVDAARARRDARPQAKQIDYDRMRRTFPRHKAALTRAVKTKDPEVVAAACKTAVAEWNEIGAWPDNWSAWQRALDDALPWVKQISLEDL